MTTEDDFKDFVKVFEKAQIFPFKHIVTDGVGYRLERLEIVMQLCDNPSNIRSVDLYLANEIINEQIVWLNEFKNLKRIKFYYDCQIKAYELDLSAFEPMESVELIEICSIIECLEFIDVLFPSKFTNIKNIFIDLGCSICFYEETFEAQNFIHKIAKKTPSIQLQFTDEYFRPDNQDSSFRGLIRLKQPNIFINQIGVMQGRISAQLVDEFATIYPEVQHLKYEVDQGPTNLHQMARNFPNLRFLNISNITDFLLENILESFFVCKNLESLTFQFNGNEEVEISFLEQVREFPKLKRFTLQSYNQPFDFSILDFQMAVKSLAHLEYLEIGFQTLLDSHVQLILFYLKKLKELTISYCYNLSNEAFEHLNNLKDLRCLKLIGGRAISDEVFSKNSNLKVLERLDLGNFHCITDISLQKFALNSPFLYQVKFEDCKEITDEGIINFSNELKYLKCLKLVKCAKLTKNCKDHFVNNSKLRSFNLEIGSL